MAPVKALLVVPLLLATSAFAGCFGDGAGQCGASTGGNSLSFGCQVANKSGVSEYTFDNRNSGARISMGSQIASGSLLVRISDDAGKTVFERSYTGASQQGDSTTASGRAGTWHVVLEFRDVTGQIGLTITGQGGAGGSFPFG